MKNRFKLIMSLMIFLLVGCAADTHSSLSGEMISNMEKLVEVLESVKDSSSSKQAILKIKEINELAERIQERMTKLNEPSEDIVKDLEQKYSSRAGEASIRLREVVGGLIETEFGLDIMNALNN